MFLQGFVQAGGQDRILAFCKSFIFNRLAISARRFESYSGSLDCGQGPYWAYVLENPAGRFYVGSTDDLEQRLAEHNSEEKLFWKYTHKNGPWRLVWAESHKTRGDAMKREKQIKRMKSAKWISENLLNW